MVLKGRKVLRPPSRRLRYWMAALPSSSRSTTMCCMAPPRAVSMATVQWSGTWSSPATGPWTPLSWPRRASPITSFTALE